jgi:hypothetical protein
MTSEEKLREEYSCRYQLNAGTLHFSSMDIEVPPELASMLAEEVDGMSARSFVEKSTLKLSGGDSAFSFSSSAMYLSLCGWSCLDHDDRHSDAITCAICSRVVRKHSKPFNPLLEHKFYCPWAQIDANVADQSTAIDDRDNIPGWKLTLLSILSIDSNGRRAQKRQSFVGRGANYSIIRAPVNNLNPESTETAMSPEGIYKRVRAILDSTVSCMPPTYVPRPADMEVSERVAASGVNTTPGV